MTETNHKTYEANKQESTHVDEQERKQHKRNTRQKRTQPKTKQNKTYTYISNK